MRIFVARHGLTEMNKQGVVNAEVDEPLAKEGVKQAHDSAPNIPKSINQIYSSPLQRAVQTAKIFVPSASIKLSIEPALTEVKMGSLAGKAWTDMPAGEELKQLHRTVKFNYKEFGGETLDEVISRIKSFITNLERKHLDDEVLLVTHGGVIRVLHYLQNKEAIYETEKNLKVLTFDTKKLLA